MSKISDFIISENESVAKNVFELKLKGDTSLIKKPGQFVNIAIDNFYLRRPISICDYDDETIVLIYKVVGNGTKELSKKKVNEKLNILYPLGNGFDIEKSTLSPVLIGGGVGVPPLIGLARALIKKFIYPQFVMGFNTQDEVFGVDLLKNLGIVPYIVTLDGSLGYKGLVTDVLDKISFDYIFTCGPEPMLKALYNVDVNGQFSFEQRMACGFGGCMGCSCKTKYGYKRICKEGPVLFKEEILW